MKSTRMKVLLGVAAVIAVAALLLAGCAKPKPPEGVVSPRPSEMPGPAAKPEGEPIKIGAIFSVTGPASPLGDPEKKAVAILVEQVNSQGGVLGRPVEVIVKDDKSMPDNAVKAANDLIEQGVVAIIGPSRTPTTMPLKEICQEAEVPLISCAAGKTITDPVASYVFAVPQTNTLAVEKCFQYLEKEGIGTVASIYVANPFGEDGQNNIEAIAAEKGVEIVAVETFGGDDTVMETQLTKIKAAKPGALICWGTNPGPAIVCKNAKTIGLDVPILQSHGVANMKFIELAGEAANGIQLPAGRLIVWEQLADDNPFKSLLEEFATA
ncbi:MAG: ABC transporter substrate-binding protein, partial [Armatimonadetes bacterium]|nr:ABC transporter substrate-binding protein [Armatimonadota bacterium]